MVLPWRDVVDAVTTYFSEWATTETPSADASTEAGETSSADAEEQTDHTATANRSCEDHVRELLTECEETPVPQAALVSRASYSEASVSKALSALETKGEVTRYQIGREKYVAPGDQTIDDIVFGEATTE